MTVLITGIDGFVGSHAAEYLLTIPSVKVHGTFFEAQPGPNIRHLASRVTVHRADIADPAAVLNIFERVQPERVIHLAGQAFLPASLKDPADTFRANVSGGIAVLEAVRRQKSRTGKSPALEIVSSGEVYGIVPPVQQPITEEQALRPNNPYAASKAGIDLIAQEYRHSLGVNVTVVRPFNHIGPRQSPAFVCSDFAKQFAEIAGGRRQPVLRAGNLESRRDFTDVRDIVRAYWMLFDRSGANPVFNICSGVAVRIGDILTALEEISGIAVRVETEESRIRSYEIPSIVGSNQLLRHATGWSPLIPLRKTLTDLFAYWKDAIASAR